MLKYLSYFLLCFISFSANSNVMITPLSMELDVKKALTTYTMENLSGEEQTYQMNVFARLLNLKGEEVNVETKDLRIFPNKILLKPNQKKRIKVMYLGKKDITSELPFRVIFEPVVVGEKQSGVAFNYRFVTSLYVLPRDAKEKLVANVESGQLHIQNLGNKHAVLRDWGVVFNQGMNNEVIYKEALPTINMLAKSNVVFPLKAGIAPSQFQSIDIISLEK